MRLGNPCPSSGEEHVVARVVGEDHPALCRAGHQDRVVVGLCHADLGDVKNVEAGVPKGAGQELAGVRVEEQSRTAHGPCYECDPGEAGGIGGRLFSSMSRSTSALWS